MTSNSFVRTLNEGWKKNQTMNDFELKYGENDDYMNTNKMLDFNTVRRKNYNNIVKRTNNTLLRRSNSNFRMTENNNSTHMPSIYNNRSASRKFSGKGDNTNSFDDVRKLDTEQNELKRVLKQEYMQTMP